MWKDQCMQILRDLASGVRDAKADKSLFEGILGSLREEYIRGKLSNDTVEEIKSLKARINTQMKTKGVESNRFIDSDLNAYGTEMKTKGVGSNPKCISQTNQKNNRTFCPRCGSKTLRVSFGQYGTTGKSCSTCGYNNKVSYF